MGEISEMNRLDDDLRELDEYLQNERRARQIERADAATGMKVSYERNSLLYQDEIWIDREGNKIPLSKIDARYAGNIMHWLLQRARLFKNRAEYMFITDPGPHGDMAQLDMERAFGELLEQTPEEYIKDSELYKALDLIVRGPPPDLLTQIEARHARASGTIKVDFTE